MKLQMSDAMTLLGYGGLPNGPALIQERKEKEQALEGRNPTCGCKRSQPNTTEDLNMKTPTTKEIAAELATLKDMAPRIRQRDAFGGDNRAAIDAQIRVLEKDMDEDEIHDKWDDENDYDIESSAMEARQWLDGEEAAPSEGWKALLPK